VGAERGITSRADPSASTKQHIEIFANFYPSAATSSAFSAAPALIAEIDQRGNHIFLHGVCHGLRSFLPAPPPAALSRSSSTMRSAVFLPIPGMRVASPDRPPRNRFRHFVGGHAAQDLNREGRGQFRFTVSSFRKSCFSASRKIPYSFEPRILSGGNHGLGWGNFFCGQKRQTLGARAPRASPGKNVGAR